MSDMKSSSYLETVVNETNRSHPQRTLVNSLIEILINSSNPVSLAERER